MEKIPRKIILLCALSALLLSYAQCTWFEKINKTKQAVKKLNTNIKQQADQSVAILEAMKPKITPMFIPRGYAGRSRMSRMYPLYITIHSTQSYSTGANAKAHALALKKGKLKSKYNSLGYLTWHYTVDEYRIYQSLPDNEQGEHADYEGPGNQSSIGIEMCENAGNSRARTLERTARLVAYLMKKHNIPLENVLAHYHWHQIRFADQKDLGHKNCPHFLLEKGKPGKKWKTFLRQVQQQYKKHH